MHQIFTSGEHNREDVWVQTKFTSLDGQDPKRIPYDRNKTAPEQVKESIEVSRQNLKVDIIDSLVLHSPIRGEFQATLDVWKAMETGVDEGKIQILGISNCYDFQFFTQLYNSARHKPKILQNRFYSKSNWDNDLRAYCLQNGIVYQTFWTLTGNPNLLDSQLLKQTAKKYKITEEQVLYRFLVDLGHQPLSGCKSLNHVKEAVLVKDLTRLTDAELTGIKHLVGDKYPLYS